MSINLNIEVVETALWPQRDARDPLGVWGARGGVTGDASGGVIRAFILVPASKRRGRIYTCYNASTTCSQETVPETSTAIRSRLLTNWPDVDVVQVGAQGFAGWIRSAVVDDGVGNAPVTGPSTPLIFPNDRFILLFDPGVVAAGLAMVIIEMERNANVDSNIYDFQAYGYYWDRQILDTPGGPRHPGSS